MNNSYALLAILLSAIVTYSLRALPFAIFRDGKMSPILSRLAMVLPAAIMAVLVVYGLKDTLSADWTVWAATIADCGSVMALHAWKHNTILSVFAGTAVYIALLYLL